MRYRRRATSRVRGSWPRRGHDVKGRLALPTANIGTRSHRDVVRWRVTAALAAVGSLLVSGYGWPQPRYGPTGTGFNPFESTIAVSNVSGLHRRWFEESGAPAFESSPVVADGVVY